MINKSFKIFSTLGHIHIMNLLSRSLLYSLNTLSIMLKYYTSCHTFTKQRSFTNLVSWQDKLWWFKGKYLWWLFVEMLCATICYDHYAMNCVPWTLACDNCIFRIFLILTSLWQVLGSIFIHYRLNTSRSRVLHSRGSLCQGGVSFLLRQKRGRR